MAFLQPPVTDQVVATHENSNKNYCYASLLPYQCHLGPTYNNCSCLIGHQSRGKNRIANWSLLMIIAPFILFGLMFFMLDSSYPAFNHIIIGDSSDQEQNELGKDWYRQFVDDVSDDQFVISLLYHYKFCQKYYAAAKNPQDNFVCQWLHVDRESSDENLNADRNSLEKQWLAMTTSETNNWQQPNSNSSTGRAIFLAFLRKQALRYYFRPRLSAGQRQLLENLTRTCLRLVDQVGGISHFIFAGSLVGFARHNKQIIPWDDDIDIGLLVKRPDMIPVFATELQQRAAEQYPGLVSMAYIPKLKRIKCYSLANAATKIDEYQWSWPFVDFQFMRLRRYGLFNVKKIIQDMDRFYENYDYDDVFPLKTANFSNVAVNVPHDVSKALDVAFRSPEIISNCQSPTYDHRLERAYSTSVTVNCQEIINLY